MNEKKIQYVIMALMVIVSLVLGYFGIQYPVDTPVPAPLPTETPMDLEWVEEAFKEMADDVESVADDVDGIGDQVNALEVQALMGSNDTADVVSFGVSYSVPCYHAQGGEEWVADDGCTWTVASGATLDVQSGATVTMTDATLTTASVTTLTVGTYEFAVSSPITISGVLSNVRVLYYQVP